MRPDERGWPSRLADRLTWSRVRAYSVGLCIIYIAIWGASVIRGAPPLNSNREPIGGDYIAFYAAGRLVLQGQASLMYDRAAVQSVQSAALNGAVPGFYDPYRNPPFFALVFAPLAWLDLLPSFALWSIISLALLWVALWQSPGHMRQRGAKTEGLLLACLGFPGVYFCLIDGQNSTLSLLLYVLVYRALLAGRERRAGTFAALGLFKPQLFFLLPVLLFATRRWRSLGAYVGTTALLALISLSLVGTNGIVDWARSLLDFESGNAERNGWRMSSVTAFITQLVPGHISVALALSLVACTALVGLLIAVWRRPGGDSLSAYGWSLTVLIALLVDPHLVDYDLTTLVLVGILVTPVVPSIRLLAVVLYALMLVRFQIPLLGGSLQLVTVALVAAGYLVYRRLGHARPSSRLPSPVGEPELQPG